MAIKNKISKAGQQVVGKTKKILGKRRQDKSGTSQAGKA